LTFLRVIRSLEHSGTQIIIFHGGVKDLQDVAKGGLSLDTVVSRYWSLWATLLDPKITNATVLLTKMTPIPSLSAIVNDYNGKINVGGAVVQGKHVLEAPMVLNEADISKDGIHPTNAGYEKMAQQLYIYWHYLRDRRWIP
jgi:hypothetical protein